MTYFRDQERLKKLIDSIAEGFSMRLATAAAFGSKSKVAWAYIRNSKKEKEAGLPFDQCKYVLHDWPEDGESHYLVDAFAMAQQISKLDFHLETLEEIRKATRPVIEGGKIQYEIDEKAIAEFSDAQSALDFGGLTDWPFKHDAKGARIPLRVRDRPTAQLLIAALKAMLPNEWNVEQKVSVEKKVSGFLVVGAAPASKPETPLVRDLRTKLDALRANGPANPKPNSAVRIEGRGGANDPPEKISAALSDDVKLPVNFFGDRTVRPHAPVPDYRRKSSPSLDAVNRPTGRGGHPIMPPGGFSVTNPGRPT
jgi:hypothetical protein